MIRAYDDNENVVDLVEWEKQIRANAIDEILAKVHTRWLFIGDSGKPYREEIEYISEQIKGEYNT